jgi:hypothetical protein
MIARRCSDSLDFAAIGRTPPAALLGFTEKGLGFGRTHSLGRHYSSLLFPRYFLKIEDSQLAT